MTRSQSSLPAAREQSLVELGRLREKLLADQSLPAALDGLMGMAEHHARYWLLGTKKQLDLVFFAMMPGEVEMWAIVNYPGQPARDLMLAELRGRMRERAVVAYSFVTEAWISEAADRAAISGAGWQDGQQPSKQPDRQEYVQALATDGFNSRFAGWKIRRDYKGAVAALDGDPSSRGASPFANLLGGIA